MDEMRSEIRAAFEKEQMAHAPTAALRHDVVDAVSAQPRRAPNLQWVAIAAALILGILVVVGLMSTRFHPRATVPANPNATPKASPVADYGPPPAGVPLLYVHDPSHPTWLIGYDWSGQPRGTVKLDPALVGVGMAPDGQSFVVGAGGKGGSGTFFDRLGQPIPWQGGVIEFASNVWADDNQHMCTVSLDQQTFEWALNTQLPTEAIKRVAVIARDSGAGQSGIGLVACSFHNNFAIAVRTTIAWPAELWVIRLTDGSVLSHHSYPFQELATVVASADGQYLAENVIAATSPAKVGGSVAARIRRVSDWTIVATLPANEGVLGFSGDDSLVLVSTEATFNPYPRLFGIVDWKAGSMVWRNPSEKLTSFTAEPGSSSFAMARMRPQSPVVGSGPDPVRDVTIVHGDGTSTTILVRYQPTW